MKIIYFNALSDDRNGNNLFSVDVDDVGEMDFKTIIEAKFVSSDGEYEIPCEIYRPRLNNEFEPLHLDVRSASRLGLKQVMKVGDFLILED